MRLRCVMRLLWLLPAVAFSVAAQESTARGTCNFEAYRPLKLGTPIRGGHEQLATKRVTPEYPKEAQRNGIAGRVDTQVLIDRNGDVVKVCARGESVLARSVEEAVMKWKFQKDFGFVFTRDSLGGSQYALLILSFDFKPATGDDSCMAQLKVAKNTGFPPILSSERLLRMAVRRVKPTMPTSCRCEGIVWVRMLVDVNGEVKCAEPGPGHPLLVYSALAGLRQWRFEPLQRRGERIPFVGQLSVQFSSSSVQVLPK